MIVRAGTSGFSYKAWKGPFYPEKLPAADMLGYYATQLPAVELNNTFYRMPRTSVVEGWAAQVPEDFRFVLKASRRITHFKRLNEPGDETTYFIDTARLLGERLGMVLFQLPPKLPLDIDRFAAFLEFLPEDFPAAFEFRHESWADPAVDEQLEKHGKTRCFADTDDDDAPVALTRTSDRGYLRLRRMDYPDDALLAWLDRIRATGWSEVYVFFKHEDAGAGPRMAGRFLELGREGVG